MHKIEVTEINKVLEFPETAHEFTRAQVIAFSKLALLYQSGHITFNKLKTQMVYSFLNMKRTADLTKDENSQILENIYIISQLVDNYFTEVREGGKAAKQINMHFFMQKLPQISVGKFVFYGPTDALFNTVYGEYLQLTTLLTDYATTSQEAVLDQLIATIYY